MNWPNNRTEFWCCWVVTQYILECTLIESHNFCSKWFIASITIQLAAIGSYLDRVWLKTPHDTKQIYYVAYYTHVKFWKQQCYKGSVLMNDFIWFLAKCKDLHSFISLGALFQTFAASLMKVWVWIQDLPLITRSGLLSYCLLPILLYSGPFLNLNSLA